MSLSAASYRLQDKPAKTNTANKIKPIHTLRCSNLPDLRNATFAKDVLAERINMIASLAVSGHSRESS
jgi:hypothetical protein